MSVEIVDIGTDINSSWSFKNGDLVLSSYTENIIQSIYKRLNTNFDSLYLYYSEYGSFLQHFFGWKKTSETLGFIKNEIINTLEQDPRLQNIDVEVSFGENGVVNGNIYIVFNEDTDLSLSMVLNNLNVEIEEVEE